MPTPSLISNHHTGSFEWRDRLRAAAIHLALSALVAGLAALLVFALWYPYPYRELSGGRELFLLVVSVDVAIGPLITFAVFNRAKPRAELRRDLAIVGLLQIAALAYGMWTVYLARPIHLVFEYDRFRVVHLIDVPPELKRQAAPEVDVAPLTGPTTLALRSFQDDREKFEMTMAALQGVQLSARPELWRPYATERKEVLAAARPAAALYARFPQRKSQIEAAVQKTGRPVSQLVSLPVIGRKADGWTALLDGSSAQIVGFLPLDSF